MLKEEQEEGEKEEMSLDVVQSCTECGSAPQNSTFEDRDLLARGALITSSFAQAGQGRLEWRLAILGKKEKDDRHTECQVIGSLPKTTGVGTRSIFAISLRRSQKDRQMPMCPGFRTGKTASCDRHFLFGTEPLCVGNG